MRRLAGATLLAALAWRWLWVGPRVSAGFLSEGGSDTATALTLEYVFLRVVKSW